MARDEFRIEGMDQLRKVMKEAGKVPQRHVTSSARKGMNIVLKGARANAPEDTGTLKRGMKLKGERSRQKATKVYQVIFDAGYNHIFQKKNLDGKITGYYPVSQEYGYFAKNGRYIPGFRFTHQSLTTNARTVESTIVNELKRKLDAELRKGGL